MEKKSDKVRRLLREGQHKEALRLAKDFRLGIKAADSDAMKRGYECIVHPAFYRSIGVDVEQAAQIGIQTLERLYGT